MNLNISKMTTKKRKTVKRKTAHHKTPARQSKVHEPNFMIQVSEPKILRKDVLEALRDVIIFMQGYEKFRKIQEEKIATFAQLRDDVKELTSLMDSKLKKYFPKGKLRGVTQVRAPVELKDLPSRKSRDEPTSTTPAPLQPLRVPEEKPSSELDALEGQLKDIENRLKTLH